MKKIEKNLKKRFFFYYYISYICNIIKQWVIDKAESHNDMISWEWQIVREPEKVIIKKESDGKYGLYIEYVNGKKEPIVKIGFDAGEKVPDWMSQKYIESTVKELTIYTQNPDIDISRFKKLEELTIWDYDLAGSIGQLGKLPKSVETLSISSYRASSPDVDLRDFGKVASKMHRVTWDRYGSRSPITINSITIGDFLSDFNKLRCKKMIFDLNNQSKPSVFETTGYKYPSISQCIIDEIEFINIPSSITPIQNGLEIKDCKLKAEDIEKMKEMFGEKFLRVDTQTLKRSGVIKKGEVKDRMGYPIVVGDIVAVATGKRGGSRFGGGATYLHVDVLKVDKVTDSRISAGGSLYDPATVIVLDADWIKKRDTQNVFNL